MPKERLHLYLDRAIVADLKRIARATGRPCGELVSQALARELASVIIVGGAPVPERPAPSLVSAR